MTNQSLALAAACVMMAVVALLAMARARRAVAASPAGAAAVGPVVAPEAAFGAPPAESAERAHHAQILEEVARTADDLAHDLKDLLTAITGRTELLLASLDAEHPGRPDAYEIRRLALSAARISRPLRALSRSHLATDLIDINRIASRAADAFKEMLGGDIAVSLALDPGVMPVRAAPGHLEEIILTLAMKSRAAMPDGGRLTLSTARHTRQEADGTPGDVREYVRIVLTDTGIEGDATPTESTIAPPTDDAAVGLAKVFDVVKQAGGTISVESTVGIGTTVVVDLPAAIESTAVPAASSKPSIEASVLVVEDEPRIRELVQAVLSRDGHDVVAVSGPHEAMAALKRLPGVEVMLVDVVMPDMNGYDLALHARTLAPGLRVIFMSGFAPDLTRHLAGDRFLAKPFAAASLQDAVQQALSNR